MKPSQQILHQNPGPYFLSLGGAGEIGANFYLYGSGGYWLAIDCGQGFHNPPAGETLSLIPDPQALKEHGIQLQAVLITHAHEDHIGALPWLADQLNCPIYATPFAAGLIEARLSENPSNQLTTKIIKPLKQYTFGPFSAEWVPVTHSIPEAQGIYLQVAGRKIYHTGDWKLDPQPVVGPATAIARLKDIGQAGLDLVIGDSTNAPNPGHSESELKVQQTLKSLISPLDKRLLVTCFASNVARLSSLGEIAKQTNRQVVLLGRSMERIYALAKRLGYLDSFPPPIPVRDLGYLPKSEQMILCTGSQGEPRAALARLAQGRHPLLELEAGDQVIFSSKTIPGNEDAVARLHAQLQAKNLAIITEHHPPIHASGHPAQQEIQQLYTWLKPKHLLAMHGEERHQNAHCQLAKSLDINARSAQEGEIYDLSALPRKVAQVTSGKLLLEKGQLKAWN